MFKTLPAPKNSDLLTEREAVFFERTVFVEPNSGCWIWTGAINQKGYAQQYVAGGTRRSHKISYRMYCGEVPKGLLVLHKCDLRCCVRPDHLFIGTHGDNAIDMVAKNRHGQHMRPGPRELIFGRLDTSGENNCSAVLTESQANNIRTAEGRQIDIARSYGISRSQVGRIKRGENWKGKQ